MSENFTKEIKKGRQRRNTLKMCVKRLEQAVEEAHMVSYTIASMVPQKKKSVQVKSGEIQ